MSTKKWSQRGFTLMELAIVVLAIGMVVGTVYAGINIIGGAKVRALKNEITEIDDSIQQFKGRYGGMPGDLADAEGQFGCTSCNGNGDGVIDATEATHFWQHLSVSNIIKGEYDPTSAVLGVGYPKSSAFDNSGYKLETRTGGRTVLVLSGGNGNGTGAISPQLAEKMDSELDDGSPLSGAIIVEAAAGAAANACNSSNTYVSTGEDSVCNLVMLLGKDGLLKEDGEKLFYQYRWRLGDWGACSVAPAWETGTFGECQIGVDQGGEGRLCGNGYQERTVNCPVIIGTQNRTVDCVDIGNNVVASGNCSGIMPGTVQDCRGECPLPMPASKQDCDLGSCESNDWVVSAWSECNAPAAWVVGAWSGCSGGVKTRTVTCDLAATGTQVRSVYCPTEGVTPCSGAEPDKTQSCSITSCQDPVPAASTTCDTAWQVGDWSACSATWTTGAWSVCPNSPPSCTVGTQTRTVTCDISPATQTRTVTCPNDPDPCVGVQPADTQACDQTCDVAATPINSQDCNVPSDLQVLNSVSYLQRHTITGDNYVACLMPTTCSTQSLDCGNSQNCSFTAAAEGETFTATCPSGYTGSPQRTCSSGTWGALSGGCSPSALNSCSALLAAGNTTNGVYTINPGSGNISVYCDMTDDGGGWTMVAAQFETNEAPWNEGIQADYDPTLATSKGFALNTSQIPSHTQTAFGKGTNATFVGYSNFVYTTGDIAKQNLVNLKTGATHQIHRSTSGMYSGCDPEMSFNAAAIPGYLTYDKTGGTFQSWCFMEGYGATYGSGLTRYDGYGMNGDMNTTNDTFAWTVWVRDPTLCSTQSLDCGNSQTCSFTGISNGSTRIATCPTGYTGSPQRTCSAGAWGALSGSCAPVDCGALSNPANGTVSTPTTTYNSTATYGCNSGYTLSGSATRTCQAGGTWSGSAPTCVANSCAAQSQACGSGQNCTFPAVASGAVSTATCPSGFYSTVAPKRTCTAGTLGALTGSCWAYASCKDLKTAGYTTSGTYYIDAAGTGVPYQTYCNQTTDGGGWTLVAIQYEGTAVAWTGSTLYSDPVMAWANGSSWTLSSSQIPISSTETGFGKDSDPTFVDRVTFHYTTGDIAKTVVTSAKTGFQYHIHRNASTIYGFNDPENGTISAGWNVLTIDRVGITDSFSWSFGINAGCDTVDYTASGCPLGSGGTTCIRGYSMGGCKRNTTETYSWTVWVR